MGRRKKNQRITQGGYLASGKGYNTPDIVLQQPQLFMFDLSSYMSAVKAAKGIDYSRRVQLYDMYESCDLDLHLSGVIAKRLRGATRIPIEFRRDGKPIPEINELLDTSWFREMRKDIILAQFWGYSLIQIYRDEQGKIGYDLIPRKHYDPIGGKLLKFQGDLDGTPIEEYPNMIFVGKPRDLGILAVLLIGVLYKRGSISDWAKFCNIWGIPIREYTYNAGDEETRQSLIRDARSQGSNAVYIHPKESDLNIIQAGDKTGSSQLFESFVRYWDNEMSIRVLGNTLTTSTQGTGTYAQAKVHQEGEEEMQQDDCAYLLDVLNDQLIPILEGLGIPLGKGRFVYAKEERIDVSQQMDVVLKANSLGVPISDDYIYELTGIDKPENYDELKAERLVQREAARTALEGRQDPPSPQQHQGDTNGNQTTLKQRLGSFFGLAPHCHRGADSEDW